MGCSEQPAKAFLKAASFLQLLSNIMLNEFDQYLERHLLVHEGAQASLSLE